MSGLKHTAPFDPDDPDCPPEWKELNELVQQFLASTDSDERFAVGRKITELSKRIWEFGRRQ